MEKPYFSLTVGALAFCFFCYFVSSAIFLVLYSYVHYTYMLMLKGDDDKWSKSFVSGTTFEMGWRRSKCIITAVVLLLFFISLF